MSEKKIIQKKDGYKKGSSEILSLIDKKLFFFQDVIQKTVLHVQKNKLLEIVGVSEVTTCINTLFELSEKIKSIQEHRTHKNTNTIINDLQEINNELSGLFKIFGTESFEDLLWICFGNNSVNTYAISDMDKYKFELLKKYFHPTSYRVLNIKKQEGDKSNKFEESLLNEKSKNLDCIDIGIKVKSFHLKIYGIQMIVHNPQHNKSLIISGIVDDTIIDFLNNIFVNLKYKAIKENCPSSEEFQGDAFTRYIKSLNLKDYLISEPHEIYAKFAGYLTNLNLFRQKTITQLVKEFINSDLFSKRNILIQLLIKSDNYDNKYLAYLLYDLLSNDANGLIDTQEQMIMFDSFPWSIKQNFKDAMKSTIQYTNDLLNFENQKIPLEQQICLLKVSDAVKEKAMQKLKEVKAKSEDSGSKARQYLDGLIKIPFNIYKREPILNIMNDIKITYAHLLQVNNITNKPIKKNYTSLEILTQIKKFDNESLNAEQIYKNVSKILSEMNSTELKVLISKINLIITNKEINIDKLKLNKKIDEKRSDILTFIKCKNINDNIINGLFNINKVPTNENNDLLVCLNDITQKYDAIKNYMKNVKSTLDKAVYGHDKAKIQIERIIAQWINGKQDGYCFGFEGPPGVGKCFGKNTPIMLFNGSIKLVQDINIGDKLMGDDSCPRNVLALGSGNETMYEINQSNGDPYIVNQSHILSLVVTALNREDKDYIVILKNKYYKNDIVDINILDYLNLRKDIKSCLKGYKVALEFDENYVSYSPYKVGYLLSASSNTTSVRPTELISLSNYLSNNIYIPYEYKHTSSSNRLEMLAGIIDGYGSYNNTTNSLEIYEKNTILAYDILWLVRSLGFKGIMVINPSPLYYIISIYGNLKRIPLRQNGLDSLIKNTAVHYDNYDNYLVSDIEIKELYKDRYYGFYIDGNSRFLLGDFTVAHNTSLAKKGLADCLKDEQNISRPFAMIQMGGDANGSSLHGHNYTYVGSTWGSIVQILIDKKCMNPIIFIDEIDKISKTEHGKEIIGILTHLLDPAQNDCFQDKYFSGIDLNLSKALFILSYNDADVIDKILLDRVHRVKFKSLSLEEKIIVSKNHILPEIYDKMGLEGMIIFTDDVLKFIIDEYTLESGVRKLKEILFEIVGEINLNILKNDNIEYGIPINITIEDIKTKYFKEKHEIKHKKIHNVSKIGIINGLWANALGQGGIIPIQANWRPSQKLLELHLTGMQGDVMKESMNVALTLAWNLTNDSIKNKLTNGENKNGVHVHCPEGATPKDGPSAGTAITTTIYSLFNNMKIKHNIAITGEITLDGNVTQIGGLDLKFLGGIKAGVTEFLYPTENSKDYDNFMEKYKDDELLNGIKFYAVDKIEQVFELVFEENI